MSLKPYSFGKISRSIQTINGMEMVMVVVIIATLVAIMFPLFGRSHNHQSENYLRENYPRQDYKAVYPAVQLYTKPATPVPAPHQCKK